MCGGAAEEEHKDNAIQVGREERGGEVSWTQTHKGLSQHHRRTTHAPGCAHKAGGKRVHGRALGEGGGGGSSSSSSLLRRWKRELPHGPWGHRAGASLPIAAQAVAWQGAGGRGAGGLWRTR